MKRWLPGLTPASWSCPLGPEPQVPACSSRWHKVSGKMEEKTATMEGATRASSEIILKTIYSPLPSTVEKQRPQRVSVGRVPGPKNWFPRRSFTWILHHPSGTMLKEPQIASSWAEHTTVFEWRATRPLKLREFREWGLPSPSRSHSLSGLLERFGQLSMGSIAQLPPSGQPGWALAQPTFTFPDQGSMTVQSGASASFH